MRRFFSFAARAVISIVLLYLALERVNWSVIAKRLHDVEAGWFLVAIAAIFIQAMLVALRWRLIAAQCGAALPAGRAARFSLISIFFNQTLPSTIGGDAVRIWLFAREGAGWKSATYSVLADRAIGLLALALLVVVCLPWTLALVQHPVGRIALVLIAAGSLGATAAFLALGAVHWHWLERFWAMRHIAGTARVAFATLSRPRPGLQVALLSVGIHLLTVAAAWAAGRASAAPLTIVDAMLLILPVILVATIPVSIAGWGVRESAMMAAFSYAGLAETDGLVVSILFGAATFMVGIAGGLAWIFDSERRAAFGAAGPRGKA
jgi:glycosyltransferase 2 family protein